MQEFNIERPSLISDTQKTKWREGEKEGESNWMKRALIKGSVSLRNKKQLQKEQKKIYVCHQDNQ